MGQTLNEKLAEIALKTPEGKKAVEEARAAALSDLKKAQQALEELNQKFGPIPAQSVHPKGMAPVGSTVPAPQIVELSAGEKIKRREEVLEKAKEIATKKNGTLIIEELANAVRASNIAMGIPEQMYGTAIGNIVSSAEGFNRQSKGVYTYLGGQSQMPLDSK